MTALSYPLIPARKIALKLKANFRVFKSGNLIKVQFLKKLIAKQSVSSLIAELSQNAQLIGQTSDGKMMYLYQSAERTPLMLELGRLRELTFREVGEGTGASCDLDQFDQYYEHLILWDQDNQEIVGAYRWAQTQQLVAQQGVHALYTASLFNYAPKAEQYFAQGLELGRSFVQPKYWGKRSLDYLWQGIGAYLTLNPQLRYLFGPVSLSHDMDGESKATLIEFYRQHFAAPEQIATAYTPYQAKAASLLPFGKQDYQSELKLLKACLQQHGTSIPTLYKQYTELCDDGGVFFADFNLDKHFGYCIDGLVVVDVTKLKANKRKRYLTS